MSSWNLLSTCAQIPENFPVGSEALFTGIFQLTWIWFIWMEEITAKIYENFILYINLTLYFKRDALIFTSNNLRKSELSHLHRRTRNVHRTSYSIPCKTKNRARKQFPNIVNYHVWCLLSAGALLDKGRKRFR